MEPRYRQCSLQRDNQRQFCPLVRFGERLPASVLDVAVDFGVCHFTATIAS